MVEEYLEKMYQELYEKKLNLEHEYQRREVLLSNNMKFTQTLQDSLDEEFESFSPRSIDEESHRKIDSLLEEQESLQNGMETIQYELSDINYRLKELNVILENIRQKQGDIDVPLKSEENSLEMSLFDIDGQITIYKESIERDLIPDISSIIHKLEVCNKLAEIDIQRCRLELKEMERSAKKIKKKMERIIAED